MNREVVLSLGLLLVVTGNGSGANPLEQRQANLTKIGKAFHLYHEAYRLFPVADGHEDLDPQKTRLGLSWRVHLLPFLGHEGLYKKFNLDEPWDGPTNSKLISEMPDVFQSAGATKPGETCFHVLLGPADQGQFLFADPPPVSARIVSAKPEKALAPVAPAVPGGSAPPKSLSQPGPGDSPPKGGPFGTGGPVVDVGGFKPPGQPINVGGLKSSGQPGIAEPRQEGPFSANGPLRPSPGATAVGPAGTKLPFGAPNPPVLRIASTTRDVSDGTSNTIMAVEAGPSTAQPWTKPGGLVVDKAHSKAALAQKQDLVLILMCDGKVRQISQKKVSDSQFLSLLTRDNAANEDAIQKDDAQPGRPSQKK